MSLVDNFGLILGMALIPMVLSFAFRENVVYRVAERTLLALEVTYVVASGWTLIVAYVTDIFKVGGWNYLYLIWIPIGAMILLQAFKGRLFYFSRLPMALFTGATMGLLVRGFIYTGVLQAVVGAIKPISLTAAGAVNVLFLVTFALGMFYFMYTFKYRGAFKILNTAGMYSIMIFLGTLFGTLSLKRLSAMGNAWQWILEALKTLGVYHP